MYERRTWLSDYGKPILGALAIAAFIGLTIWLWFVGYDECQATAPPTCQGDIYYDMEDSECECNGEYGEIEWNIGGCGGYIER